MQRNKGSESYDTANLHFNFTIPVVLIFRGLEKVRLPRTFFSSVAMNKTKYG